MSEFRTTGIVLKRQNYSEADRILRIFTKEYGLVSALAKGVKKVKSRKAGCLEFFCESNFRLHRRNGELFLVTDASPISSFLELPDTEERKSVALPLKQNRSEGGLDSNEENKTKLEILKTAYSVAEMLLILAPPEKPLPKIYQLTLTFLSKIKNNKKLLLLKIAFYTKALNILGFLPDLDNFLEKERRLLKFLINSDFEQILKLAEEKETFIKAEKLLTDIFEEQSEKFSKVSAATKDWS